MAAAQAIKIVAHLNGDYKTAGTEISVMSNDSLQQLIDKGSISLSVADGENVKLILDHVFLSSGAQVLKVSDIPSGTHIYFAAPNEIFIQDTDDKAYLSSEAEAKRQSKLASSTATTLGNLYKSYSDFVKSKSPTFVGNTLSKVENTFGQVVGSPIVSNFTASLLGWADEKLDLAHDRWSQVRTAFEASEFAKTVDATLVAPIKQKIGEPAEVFYRGLVDEWLVLHKKGEVVLNDLINSAKSKWGSSWNDKLAEPSRQFYERAKAEYQEIIKKQDGQSRVSSIFDNLKTKLGSGWDSTVAANFKAKIATPADAFYRSAVDSFHSLQQKAGGKVEYTDYIKNLKAKLGEFWNEKLVEPAKHLYENFAKTPQPATS